MPVEVGLQSSGDGSGEACFGRRVGDELSLGPLLVGGEVVAGMRSQAASSGHLAAR
ncbi:hypothetical protein [Candidatus Poriferisodalis sp.]|uniref:hypothetical protein n=1 Tax=Candidatus Poriferisodalis sp. TaxID=3101277 RepID=UPI003C6EFC78